ncbi:MAG: ABC transporter permease subunit [Clostridia bacterium]|nr:ABC transporter permease subunit [Clostridia bacterium]MBQ7913727.1 ABC transporter permease subunit [Clostridia bacterium]
MKKALLKNLIQTGVALGVLFAAWLIAYFCIGNPSLMPAPWASAKEFGVLFSSGEFWRGFATTMARVFLAFGISFVLAVIFAVVAYLYPSFAGIFTPIASAFRSLPVLAIVLILLSILGAGATPVAVAFLSLFPMLYTGILTALLAIDKHVIEVSKVYGASRWVRIWRVYLPLSAPSVLREAGGAISFSLKLVVSAEVVAMTAQSLGYMMQDAKAWGEIPQLFALVTLTFILGLALELIMTALAEKAQY